MIQYTLPIGNNTTIAPRTSNFIYKQSVEANYSGGPNKEMNIEGNQNSTMTTNKEMKVRCGKSLCCWCPEQYSVGQSFKGKHIFVIKVGEEDYEEENGNTTIDPD